MAIEASIVVVFGEQEPGSDDIVVVEFDPQHPNNLDADGKVKSVFDPDDQPVFLLHHSETLRVVNIASSSGSVAQIGANISQSRNYNVSFAKLEDSVTLNYDNVTLGSMIWMGNEGVVTLENGNQLTLTGGTVPCLGTQSFLVTFQGQYMVTPPILELEADETYEILVVVYMEVI